MKQIDVPSAGTIHRADGSDAAPGTPGPQTSAVSHRELKVSEIVHGWRILVASAIGVGVGLGGVPFFTLGVFLKPLSEAFSWTRAEVGATSMCISIGAGLTAPFVGSLADRADVRRIALVSLVAMSAAYLGLTQLNGDVRFLYLGVIGLAVCASGTSPLVWALAVNTWFDRARGLALGLTLAGSGVTAIVAPRLVDLLIAAHGWQAGYVGIALFTGLIATPVVFFLFDGKRPQAKPGGATHDMQPGTSVGEALRFVEFWKLACGALLVNGAVVAILVHLVALLTDNGMTRTSATSIAGMLGFAVLTGRLGIGYLFDRVSASRLAGVVFTFPAIGLLLLATAPDNVGLAVISAILFGLGSGSEVDALPYLAGRLFGLRCFGTIYGLLIIAHLIGGGVGPILLGYVYDVRGSYGFGLAAIAVACLFGALLVGSLPKSFRFAPAGAH
jgi:predicted MFS family arabinose efflux permease